MTLHFLVGQANVIVIRAFGNLSPVKSWRSLPESRPRTQFHPAACGGRRRAVTFVQDFVEALRPPVSDTGGEGLCLAAVWPCGKIK